MLPWPLQRSLQESVQYRHAQATVYSKHTRIATNHNKYTLAPPMHKRLHRLLAESHCIFKTDTLVFKFLHSGLPSYFGSLLSNHCRRYSTRYNSPDKGVLKNSQSYPSLQIQKYTLTTALLLMLPWFGMIFLIRDIL